MARILTTKLRPVIYVGIFLVAIYLLHSRLASDSASEATFPSWKAPKQPPPVHHWKPPSHSSKTQPWKDRANDVRAAFQHAYNGYKKHGLPYDELRPVTHGHKDVINGWGVSVFDSLTTMLIMGLDEEFKQALPFIEKANFTTPPYTHAPFFETTIRYTGGLLSAYALSKEPILLKKAEELAAALDPVFNTTSGLPAYGVNIEDHDIARPWSGILAEIGSFQLEYSYLAHLTRNKTYYDRVRNSLDLFYSADLRATGGMLPTGWNLETGEPHNTAVSVGGEADSGHEYLLKMYLMTAKTDERMLDLYIKTTSYILSNLLYMTPHRHLLYVTTSHMSTVDAPGWITHGLDHLSCFFPGLLALGAHTLPLSSFKLPETLFDSLADEGYYLLSDFNLRDLHMWAAEGLAHTCWLMYGDSQSGLGPESVTMQTPQSGEPVAWLDVLLTWKESGSRGTVPGLANIRPLGLETLEHVREKRDYFLSDERYLLRPETLETIYLMWRTTGDIKWRERGWDIFQALERETKTKAGFASIRSVDKGYKGKDNLMDEQPSYFLAETLKYLYLLFDDEDHVPLDKWVFNTEAHPLPIFSWTEEEKKYFGIRH